MPTSLLTGITGVFVGKMHEHVLKYTKRPDFDDDRTTTPRPKIIDFISKIKKRSIQADETASLEDANCDCDKVSIVDGIAEHLAEIRDSTLKTNTNLELEEDVSLKHKNKSFGSETKLEKSI